MTRAIASRTPPHWICTIQRRCMGALRVFLVLLLVFDQLSAPLHGHHHDGSADSAHEYNATALEAQRHLEADDGAGVGHSVMAVKSEAPHVFAGEDPPPRTALVPAKVSIDERTGHLTRSPWPPDAARAMHAHRNLPPGAQAPPLHA